MSTQLEAALAIIFLVSAILIILAFIFAAISNCLHEINTKKEQERLKMAEIAKSDKSIAEQTKAHQISYPEDYSKSFEKEDLKFDVNLADSIVRAEVTYI